MARELETNRPTECPSNCFTDPLRLADAIEALTANGEPSEYTGWTESDLRLYTAESKVIIEALRAFGKK